MGQPVILIGKEAEDGEAAMKKWFMNVVARFEATLFVLDREFII
jgi:hypothetical protein